MQQRAPICTNFPVCAKLNGRAECVRTGGRERRIRVSNTAVVIQFIYPKYIDAVLVLCYVILRSSRSVCKLWQSTQSFCLIIMLLYNDCHSGICKSWIFNGPSTGIMIDLSAQQKRMSIMNELIPAKPQHVTMSGHDLWPNQGIFTINR